VFPIAKCIPADTRQNKFIWLMTLLSKASAGQDYLSFFSCLRWHSMDIFFRGFRLEPSISEKRLHTEVCMRLGIKPSQAPFGGSPIHGPCSRSSPVIFPSRMHILDSAGSGLLDCFPTQGAPCHPAHSAVQI